MRVHLSRWLLLSTIHTLCTCSLYEMMKGSLGRQLVNNHKKLVLPMLLSSSPRLEKIRTSHRNFGKISFL